MEQPKFPAATDKKVSMEMKKSYQLKKDVKNKLIESSLLNIEQKGFLIPEEGEKTLKISQKQISSLLPRANKTASYDLDLNNGPYKIDTSKNGRYILIGGHKGHVALIEWKERKLLCEFSVKDHIADVCMLHNETLFAVAQKKHLYFYDQNGLEVHAMRNNLYPEHLEFLPYHFTLASLSKTGMLRYLDITNGKIEKEIKAKSSTSMWQSHTNAIIHCGYSNGQVGLYVPNIAQPVIKFLAHSTPVLAGVCEKNYIITSGLDSKVKIWDNRTYKVVYEYYSPMPSKSLSISQRGLLALTSGDVIICWKDWQTAKQKEPYMKVRSNNLYEAQFVRYEDFIVSSHSKGISTHVVPGSGEPNFDSYEDNVFESKKQRQSSEVHKLLEKLPLDTITLSCKIGDIDTKLVTVIEEEKKQKKDAQDLLRKRKADDSKKKDRYELERIRSKNKEVVEKKLKQRKKEQKAEEEEVQALSLITDIDPVMHLKM
jgi:U3 small nucleolar RNA-associated protein 7